MKSLINALRKNETAFSIGRLCALMGFVLWAGVTIFLVALNRSWVHYDTLCISSFSFLLIQLCNKAVESRLFSVKVSDINAARDSSKQI